MLKDAFIKYSAIIGAVALYWATSISLVFANKYLLSSAEILLRAPYFFTWVQCLISFILCFALLFIAPTICGRARCRTLLSGFKPKDYLAILPLSTVFVFMVAFNNLCLENVSVSFYYIIKATTLITNAETLSPRAAAACGILFCGYLLGVQQENAIGSLTLQGFIYGSLATIFSSLYHIGTRYTVTRVQRDPGLLTLYNNFNSLFLILPCMGFSGEFTKLYSDSSGSYFTPHLQIALLVTGILGFGVGYATALAVKLTSALSHDVSGNAKSLIQTFVAVTYFRESKPILWWVGNVLALGATMYYSHVRRQEMHANVVIISKPERNGKHVMP